MTTFRLGLPQDSELKDSLTMRPLKSMHQLMRWIEEHKRLEDNRLQGKGKALVAFQYQKEHRSEGFQPRPWRDAKGKNPNGRAEGVNVAFKEPIHKILDRTKHESYFRWPNKMGRDLARRNQRLYCTYHRDKGHTTKQCKTFKDHLAQLVIAGHLREYAAIGTTHWDGENWTIKYIFPHGSFDIMELSRAIYSSSICNHHLTFQCWVKEAMQFLGYFTMNKIMGTTRINQHYYLFLLEKYLSLTIGLRMII